MKKMNLYRLQKKYEFGWMNPRQCGLALPKALSTLLSSGHGSGVTDLLDP